MLVVHLTTGVRLTPGARLTPEPHSAQKAKTNLFITELHSRTISTPLSELIRDRRLRYLGHIVRYPAHRWVRVVLNGEIGSYTGNSAKKTWVKTLQADLRDLHAEYNDCLDRQRWREICSGEIVLRAIDRAPQHLIRFEGRNRRRGVLGQNAER